MAETITDCVVEEVLDTTDRVTIAGTCFRMSDASGVYEMCGDIGDVKPPCFYVAKRSCRLFLTYSDGRVCGYCAVKFVGATSVSLASMVIDALGVHPTARKSGLGSILYNRVQNFLLSQDWIDALRDARLLGPNEEFTISLQAVYDYESYKALLAKYTTQSLYRTAKDRQVITINMAPIAEELKGPCEFWKRLGFSERRLMVHETVVNPVLIMWFKPNLRLLNFYFK